MGGWGFVFCCSFFLFFMVSSVAFRLSAALRGRASFGFSGSRSALPPASVWGAVSALVPGSAFVSVGCAAGLDSAVRRSFPGAAVFRASSFGFGRGSFAARSVALVRAVAAGPAPVWVSFPGGPCPSGLVPSSSSSRCFCGLGSGSWASLAFAVGLGVRSVVWLPVGVPFPSGWGAAPLGGGWWLVSPTTNPQTRLSTDLARSESDSAHPLERACALGN